MKRDFKRGLAAILLMLAIIQALRGASPLAAIYWAVVAAYWSQNA